MLSLRFKTAVLSFVMSTASTATFAETISIPTRFGTLTTNDMQLEFKGKPVGDIYVPSYAYLMDTYELESSDVIMISTGGGNACPGLFAFVTVSIEGARATPSFGTCYDDDVQPVRIGESLAFSMKKLGGKGSVRYIYERGVIFEDGKPVK